MTYRFVLAPYRQVTGGGKLLTYPDDILGRQEHEGPWMARFRCALLQRFGPPNVPRGDAVFEYAIDAIDDQHRVWWLTAYEGASGPSIGSVGPLHGAPSDLDAAALALLRLIADTPPADGSWTYVDDEYETIVEYGCRNGRCWYRETTNGETLVEHRE